MRRQRREFGIRRALGARERDIKQIVLSRGLKLAFVFTAMAAAVLVMTVLGSPIRAHQASRVDTIVSVEGSADSITSATRTARAPKARAGWPA